MERFRSLDEVEKELMEGKIQSLHLIELHNRLYEMPIEERIEAFDTIHRFFQKIADENKQVIETEIKSLKRKEENEKAKLYEEALKQLAKSTEFIYRRVDRLKELKQLVLNDHELPFKKGKSYYVRNWDNAFHTDTGERSDWIESKKANVLENSAFKNLYDTFILNSAAWRNVSHDTLFIQVKVSYGKWKGCPLYLPIDQLV